MKKKEQQKVAELFWKRFKIGDVVNAPNWVLPTIFK
jgi:hypothetical protein